MTPLAFQVSNSLLTESVQNLVAIHLTAWTKVLELKELRN